MSEQKITLPLSGMTCVNCAMNIERSLKKLPGVNASSVNFAAEQANISFDPGKLSVQGLVGGIEKAGYGVPAAKVDLPVTGMTCTNCAANIERALNKKTPGVVQASVNFASERASIEYLPALVTLEEIGEAIKKAGYNAILPDDSQQGAAPRLAARYD